MAGGFLGFFIGGLLVVIPFWRRLPRFGLPSWVAVFAIFPPAAIILLWIMAFRGS